MSEESYFNQEDIVKVDEKVIEELKIRAQANESGKYRLCMHHSPNDILHEMFIVRKKNDYGRPEKHMHTTESHTIIDGKLLIVIFDDEGKIIESFELSKEQVHSYRIDTNIYHMSIPITEQVVYYETKLGPFPNKGNIAADWAPEPCNIEEVNVYLKELEEKIQLIHLRGVENEK